MSDLLKDLVDYVIANKEAVQYGQDIFSNYLPNDPAHVLSLQEYDSKISPVLGAMAAVRYVQVLVRDPKASEAQAQANRLFKIFSRDEDNTTWVNSTRWCLFTPKQFPFKIKEDAQRRVIWGFNVAITTNFDI